MFETPQTAQLKKKGYVPPQIMLISSMYLSMQKCLPLRLQEQDLSVQGLPFDLNTAYLLFTCLGHTVEFYLHHHRILFFHTLTVG